jgi:cytochrome c-type biogenesis protein CcmE
MTASRKLALGAALVAGVTAYMAYLGAADSWKYYLTADECLADVSRFVDQKVRVSGKVNAGSLQINRERSQASFHLAGRQGQLSVACTGPLPDNLADGMDVVVEGRLDAGGVLRGEKLLTRCASKYEAGKPGTAQRIAAPRQRTARR